MSRYTPRLHAGTADKSMTTDRSGLTRVSPRLPLYPLPRPITPRRLGVAGMASYGARWAPSLGGFGVVADLVAHGVISERILWSYYR